MLAVDGLEVRVGGASAVCALQGVVFVELDLAPAREAVHCSRSGQWAQTAPKVTVRVRLGARVAPAGQVSVPAAVS
jgi:hypothetical protein